MNAGYHQIGVTVDGGGGRENYVIRGVETAAAARFSIREIAQGGIACGDAGRSPRA